MTARFVQRLLHLVAPQTPFQLPKSVAAQMIAELVSLIGGRLAIEELAVAERALTELLIAQLWRCSDERAQRDLVDSVLDSLLRTAKLGWTR